MTPLSINGLTMPADFPVDLFETIFGASQRHGSNPLYFHFIGAWSAISYRYKALAEYDDRFTDIIKKSGHGQARYEQERDLFGFASNAYSIFEAFHYAMFAIGALIKPEIFVLNAPADESKVNISTTRARYKDAFPGDPISVSFQEFFDDSARLDLSLLRNVLTHRAAPPRAFGLAVGPRDAVPSAELTRVNISLDENTTQSRRHEVSRLLTGYLKAAEIFVASKL
jgi:hypothetical protein